LSVFDKARAVTLRKPRRTGTVAVSLAR